jgi:hypothetical protein
LNTLDPIKQLITADEAATHHIPVGKEIPNYYKRKLIRCFNAPLADLFTHQIITSGDELAAILPQLTAQAFTYAYNHEEVQYMMMQSYRAFRSRRSLLLLDLAHQVRFEELPWVQAVETQKSESKSHSKKLYSNFQELTALYLENFPHQIIANKFLSELQQYAKELQVKMPIVEELAADIFMGSFSQKFLHAAQLAARVLTNSLYELYYTIPYSKITENQDKAGKKVKKSKTGVITSGEFLHLCESRVKNTPSKSKSLVAANGRIIEQAQIITTHNLALIFDLFDLKTVLQEKLYTMVQACFTWICRKQIQTFPNWRTKLKVRKNCAYAWRQMVFFLSFVPQDDLWQFVSWSQEKFRAEPKILQENIGPSFYSLLKAINVYAKEGDKSDYHGAMFLGWQ